jgi:hypothetical protein
MIHIPSIGQITRLEMGQNPETPFEKAAAQAQNFYAGIVGPVLVTHYPGVSWKVTVRVERSGATVYIQVPKISLKYGMVIRIPPSIPELEHEAMKAGGELLERFNIGRRGTTESDLKSLPTDVFGQVKGSDAGELVS